ncbi:MAG: DNA translocase FtsK, partial [Actinomycetota bacterium]|nr:DNA translocase FtsK [Actinomycetota bacterium]
MAAAHKKPTRKRKSPPARARRSLLAARPSLALPLQLEAHHVDIIGLGLTAVGIFLAGVAYLHWAGGALGDGAIRGSRLLLGQLGYAVPATLVLGGALV